MTLWSGGTTSACSARDLVTNDPLERSGPVAAAVRSAGCVSEEEGDGEVGSSVEEEQQAHSEPANKEVIPAGAYRDMRHDGNEDDTEPPSYSSVRTH